MNPLVKSLRLLSRRLCAEDGVALLLAISVVAILTIAAGATIQIVQSGQVSSSRERQTARAMAIGEAGLDKALNTIAASDPDGTQLTGATVTGTLPFDGGTANYSATKQSDGSWVAATVATSPDGKVTRRVETTLSPHQTTTGTTVSPVYGYGFFMADPTADCTVLAGTGNSIGNSAKVTVPVYIAGSLCLSGGGAPLIANPTGSPKITLYVGGKFRTDSNSSPVGQSGAVGQLAKATIVGGCQIDFHGWKNVICSKQGVPTSNTGSGVWADVYSSTPLVLTKPTVGATEADAAYQNAAPGPMHPCGAGSTVGPLRFDSAGSTTRNSSLGSVRLLQITGSWGSGNSFDCRFYDGLGNLTGRLAYTFGTPGALVVQGTIFIDGNLTFGGADSAVYSGKGTIYVNGTVSFTNGARLCGTSMVSGNCSGNWDPTVNSLEIVAVNSANASPGWDMSGDSQFEGTAYTNGRYVSGNSAWVQGPVIADSGQLSGDTKFKAISAPPPGAPGASTLTTTTTWAAEPGSWRQCPASAPCPVLP
jgi:hypothetical protein